MWTQTIEAHRREVHEAIQDKTASLVEQAGLRSVTMSQVAEATGIGRATLYKYYPDIETILAAWHERQVSAHVQELAAISERAPDAERALEAVLEAFAFIAHQRHDHELAGLLHQGEHVARGEQQLVKLVRGLVARAAESGGVRDDVSADELARYSVHALTAAGRLPSKAAVHRLVQVTLAGLKPPR